MLVNVEHLVPNNYNPNSMTELKFNALVASIKEENWNRLFPIEVKPESDGKYVIIDWEHRYKALVEAGIKKAHIEVSDLKNGYDKLRTISKNSIHWTHDQIEEAVLVKAIKEQGITDSEIMQSIGIDEKELIAIDNLSNFDIGDFEGDEIDISEDNEVEEEEEPKKELVLNLNEVHYDILESLSKITVTSGMQDAILIAAYYFHLLNDSDKVDETLLKATKEALFENAKIDIMSWEKLDF